MAEHEFMKSKSERRMDDDEYNAQNAKLSAETERTGARVKRAMIIFCGFLAASYLLIMLLTLMYSQANYGAGIGDYKFLAVEFIFFALLLFDPKSESDKKFKYESDRRILLNSARNIVRINKIRFYLTVFFGVLFTAVNIVILYAVFYELGNAEKFTDISRLVFIWL